MSTRSRIGLKLEDGRIVSIYCHSDGYPSYVGMILDEHYKTRDKVVKLLNLGDISVLGTEPVDCPEAWDYSSGMSAVMYEEDAWPLCRTYKGRGEETKTAIDKDLPDYWENRGWCEYCYVFDNGCWYVVVKKEDGDVTYKTICDAIKEKY